MSIYKRLITAGLFLAVCAISMARTDQNSFLNRPANTLPELISQVKNDGAVSDRFMRHFAMSKGEVLEMMSKLKMGRLPADGVYLVYNVPGWEEVRSRAMFFRKGTLVWTNADGSPVMKVSCGNPMVRGSDIGVAAVTAGIRVEPDLKYRELVTPTPETAFLDASPNLAAPGMVDVNAADVLPATPSMPSVGRASGIGGFIVPVLGGLLLGVRTGDTNPVPEPCTMLVLGAGAAVIAAKRKKKA